MVRIGEEADTGIQDERAQPLVRHRTKMADETFELVLSGQDPSAATAASCSLSSVEASAFFTNSPALTPPKHPNRRMSEHLHSALVEVARDAITLAPSDCRLIDFLRMPPAVSSAACRMLESPVNTMMSMNFGEVSFGGDGTAGLDGGDGGLGVATDSAILQKR